MRVGKQQQNPDPTENTCEDFEFRLEKLRQMAVMEESEAPAFVVCPYCRLELPRELIKSHVEDQHVARDPIQ